MAHIVHLLDFRSALLAVVITFILLFIWLRQTKRQKLPPGPFQWPLVGCLPNLAYTLYQSRVPLHQLFAMLSHTYGKVHCVSVGSKLVVILNSSETIREAFLDPLLSDRPNMIGNKNRGLGLANGDFWKIQRRFTLTTFRNVGIGKEMFVDTIEAEVEHVIEEFNSHVNTPFNPEHILNNAISNITCCVLFGKRFQYTDPDFQQLLHLLDQQNKKLGKAGFLNVIPILRLLLLHKNFQIWKIIKAIRAWIKRRVEEHKKTFDSDKLTDYVYLYLNEMKTNRFANLGLNELSLSQTVAQLFVAGNDTTTHTLRWALLYLMKFPDVQVRVQNEIDAVVGRNRAPRISDNLPYTTATIMEVLRIATILPLGVPHMAAEDTTFQGYHIPKGSIIVSNLWAVHHDPDLWLDPDDFRPDRFLDENGEICQPDCYIPFSTGRRMCVGDNLARMELFLLITNLLHRFSFTKPDTSPPLTLEGTLAATYSPLPFEMMITLRN